MEFGVFCGNQQRLMMDAIMELMGLGDCIIKTKLDLNEPASMT